MGASTEAGPESESMTDTASAGKTVTDTASAGKEPKVNITAEAFKFQDTENTILRSGQVGNGDKDSLPLEASQCELDNCDMTLLDSAATVNEPGLGQVRNADGGNDEDEINSEDTFEHAVDASSQYNELNNSDKSVMASASTKNELELDITAGASQFPNSENTFEHSVDASSQYSFDVSSECTTIIPNSGQVRNGDGGSNGNETLPTIASTKEGLELEYVTLDTSQSENTFVESGLQSEAVSVLDCNQNLPFVKKSIIWETLESSEVYKKITQKPHFRPLYEKAELWREGLALACVVTFTNIVDIICKLRFGDFEAATIFTLTKDILKVLPEFDEHGFDTEPLKNHLGKLVSARSNVAQLEVEAKETKSQLMEKSRDKIRMKEKSNVVAKELVEIVKKLKDLEDQKVNNASEIVKLTSSLDSITTSLMKNSVSI
ncbi:hypothetical protein ACFE04_026999 [Oxalis oulophora]